MQYVLRDLSTDTLIRVVAGLEARIIDGVATRDDLDAYFWAQWEIAERVLPATDEPNGQGGARR